MYAAIRQFKAKPGSADALAEKIKGAIPIISDVSGFMGYYVVYAPDDTVTAISVFNTVAEAQESNRRALAFIEDNLGPLVIGHASATAGPVIVHSLPYVRPGRPPRGGGSDPSALADERQHCRGEKAEGEERRADRP
jgi:hypothetical protein